MAGKIKKLLENELVGGTQSSDVYPVTSVKAVYDEENERLDNIINRRGVVNISTNYNSDHIAEVLTLKQAIAKVPSKDRVLGFQGKFLTKDGWETYTFTGDSVSDWGTIENWDSFANQSYVNKIEPITLVDFTTSAVSSGYVNVSRVGEYYYQSHVKKVHKVTSFNSPTDFTVKVIEPTIGQLYTYNGVIYSWNGTDMIVAGPIFTNIAWSNFNKTIELKDYLIYGYYANNGVLWYGTSGNGLDDRKSCLLRISPYTKYKITFDDTKYKVLVKYHKGIDLANGLEYVASLGARNGIEYTAQAVNYMSLAFINADKDWSTLEPVIEITVPEQVLNDNLKEQSQKITEVNTNLDSYKGSLKDMFTVGSYTILVRGSNANKGFVDNSGNFIYNTRSLSYIIDKPKFVTIENYTQLSYQVKLFNIIEGVLTYQRVISGSTDIFYHNFKEYDMAVVQFYNNIESDTDISKIIKIINSPYPPKYDSNKILFSNMGENPGNLTIGTGYGYQPEIGGSVNHARIGVINKRACTLVPMLPGKLVLSNNIKIMNIYEVIGITENKSDDVNLRHCLYRYNVSILSTHETSYNADTNQTTFTLKSSRPLLISLANANNTDEDVDFEIISYTPSSYTSEETYNIPISVNEFGDNTGKYDSFAEPIMVTAPNGTIMIGGMCGKGDAYQNVFNRFSTDKGKTWTSKWTGGHRYLTYDRVNNKLYSLDGTSLYVSSDYGMTWELKKSVPLVRSSDMTKKYNSLRDEEKEYSASHPEEQRYAYLHGVTQSPNPGVQLSNGVICFQRRELIKKYKASKDEGGNWIVDSNGYPTAEDTSFANTVDIIESVASIVYSKDYGETWETSPHTPLGVMMDELTVAEAKPNQICINGRGGTEAAWNTEKVYRHIFFQVTPIDDRESFSIDNWEADYETRITNTIEESIVNAGFAKIEGFTIPGANKEIQPFWLFCNIYNPDGYKRHSQLLRVSPDCHNWFKVKLLTSNEEIVGGYSSIASTSDSIYIIIESYRVGKPMKFINLTTEYLTDILGVLSSVKEYYN